MSPETPMSPETSKSPKASKSPEESVGTEAVMGPDPYGPGRATRHASIDLDRSRCTSCLICVVECPAWCITLSSHPEPVPGLPPTARQRTHQVLDAFTIDYGTCLYCGICIEECPFDALAWDERLVPAPPVREGLVQDPSGPALAP